MTYSQLKIKLQSLRNKESKLKSRLYKAQLDEHSKLRNLGWGTNMRGYKRSSSLNLSKSSKIEQDLELVREEISSIITQLENMED